MRVIYLVILLIMRVLYFVTFLMAIKVSAQDLKFNGDKLRDTIENQIEFLNLNESQKIQFKELNDNYTIKLEFIINSDKAKFEKFQDLIKVREERDYQVKLLLNKKQYKIYKKTQKQNQGKIRQELRKNSLITNNF